jgi:hypothetical protein
VTNWWRRNSGRIAALGISLTVLAGPLSPFNATPAAAVVGQSGLAEDYSYSLAEPIPSDLDGVELLSGDGHFLMVRCGGDIRDDTIRIAYAHGDLTDVCFRVTGPVGYIKLKVPEVYSIERDRTHLITGTLQRVDNGKVYSQRMINDRDPNCRTDAEPCYVQVGAATGAEGTDDNAADLLEMAAGPLTGTDPGILPAPPANSSVGRLTVNEPGRPGSRGCSATLVAPQWVVTAASCFGGEMRAQGGAPPEPAKVSFGGQLPRKVERVVPSADRDVALARLDVGVDIPPSPWAGAPLAGGQTAQANGFGRTDGGWGPDTSHSAAVTVSGVASTSIDFATSGLVCKGDLGGPVLNDRGEIAAVVTGSGQNGCFGATATGATASAARLDGLKAWAGREMDFMTSYFTSRQNGLCLDADSGPFGVVVEQATLHTMGCVGGYNQKWLPNADGTIRNPQKNMCLDIQSYQSADGTTIWVFGCNGSPAQQWRLNADGSVQNPGTGKCLDVDMSAGGPAGARVQLYGCNGTPAQKWDRGRRFDGEIRNPMTARCLDAQDPTGTYGAGARLQIFDCLGGPNQKWIFAADGTIRNPKTNLCLDIVNFDTAFGAPVGLWTCHGDWNQQWVLNKASGTISNPKSGNCLDLTNFGKDNLTPVTMYGCKDTDNWNQKWTTHWTDGRFFDLKLNPVGNYETVAPAPGGFRVTGWAFDPEWPDPVVIMVGIDGQFQGFPTWKNADVPRVDIGNGFPYGPNHGFDITMPAARGNHDICVFAWNMGTGDMGTLLGCRPVTV